MTFNDRNQGKSRFGFQPQIIYGVFANTQLELSTNLVTESMTVAGDDKSGDLSVGVLYNLNTETLNLPAFAVRVGLVFPTGVNSKGVDTQLTGVMTRSFGRWRTHLNIGYTFLGSPQSNERAGTYRVVAAVSYPLGYPTSFRDTLIVNVFSRQSDLVGQNNPTGLGVGLRHQVSSRVVFDTGLGTEFAGPSDRSVSFSTIGLSLGFRPGTLGKIVLLPKSLSHSAIRNPQSPLPATCNFDRRSLGFCADGRVSYLAGGDRGASKGVQDRSRA